LSLVNLLGLRIAHIACYWNYTSPLSVQALQNRSCLNYQSSLYSPGTDNTQNASSIIACFLVAGETCPQSCSLPMAVVLSPVYTAVTWQWVYISQYCANALVQFRIDPRRSTVDLTPALREARVTFHKLYRKRHSKRHTGRRDFGINANQNRVLLTKFRTVLPCQLPAFCSETTAY
jgi:hypothetical protein